MSSSSNRRRGDHLSPPRGGASKLRMDRQPATSRITDPSLPLGKRKEIDNVMKKARGGGGSGVGGSGSGTTTGDYWDKKLLEAEEKEPNRWRHTGYKKMYIEGESSSDSDSGGGGGGNGADRGRDARDIRDGRDVRDNRDGRDGLPTGRPDGSSMPGAYRSYSNHRQQLPPRNSRSRSPRQSRKSPPGSPPPSHHHIGGGGGMRRRSPPPMSPPPSSLRRRSPRSPPPPQSSLMSHHHNNNNHHHGGIGSHHEMMRGGGGPGAMNRAPRPRSPRDPPMREPLPMQQLRRKSPRSPPEPPMDGSGRGRARTPPSPRRRSPLLPLSSSQLIHSGAHAGHRGAGGPPVPIPGRSGLSGNGGGSILPRSKRPPSPPPKGARTPSNSSVSSCSDDSCSMCSPKQKRARSRSVSNTRHSDSHVAASRSRHGPRSPPPPIVAKSAGHSRTANSESLYHKSSVAGGAGAVSSSRVPLLPNAAAAAAAVGGGSGRSGRHAISPSLHAMSGHPHAEHGDKSHARTGRHHRAAADGGLQHHHHQPYADKTAVQQNHNHHHRSERGVGEREQRGSAVHHHHHQLSDDDAAGSSTKHRGSSRSGSTRSRLDVPEDPRLKVRPPEPPEPVASKVPSSSSSSSKSKSMSKSEKQALKLRAKVKIEGEKRPSSSSAAATATASSSTSSTSKKPTSSSASAAAAANAAAAAADDTSDSDDSDSSDGSLPTVTATTRLTLSERFGKMAQWSVDRSNMENMNMRITKDSADGALKVMIEEGLVVAAEDPPRRYSYSPAPAGHYPEELATTAPTGLMSWDDVRVRYEYYKSRGYLRDLDLKDYVKWEEWWYRYQEWLKQERYHEFYECQQMLRRRRKKIPIAQRLN